MHACPATRPAATMYLATMPPAAMPPRVTLSTRPERGLGTLITLEHPTMCFQQSPRMCSLAPPPLQALPPSARPSCTGPHRLRREPRARPVRRRHGAQLHTGRVQGRGHVGHKHYGAEM